METATERTGWRDEKLSKRHREWGYDCPAVDIDFLMCEYDQGEPVAIVEYKNEHHDPHKTSPTAYKALVRLGDMANIPVIKCTYSDDLSSFTIAPLNHYARETMQRPDKITITEKQYVQFLYFMRNRKTPDEILAILKG